MCFFSTQPPQMTLINLLFSSAIYGRRIARQYGICCFQKELSWTLGTLHILFKYISFLYSWVNSEKSAQLIRRILMHSDWLKLLAWMNAFLIPKYIKYFGWLWQVSFHFEITNRYMISYLLLISVLWQLFHQIINPNLNLQLLISFSRKWDC